MAACGNRTITAAPGTRFLTINPRNPSAPLPWRHPIPISFTSLAAKACNGPIFPSVTESTNQLTPEKPGSIWDCATGNKFPRWPLIREIQTSYSLRCSDIRMAPTLSAEFFGPPTAETLGKRCCPKIKTPAALMLKSIRRILTLFTLLCGNRAWAPGKTTTVLPERMAACSSPQTEATHGGS